MDSSEEASIVLRPLWSEEALYSDAVLDGALQDCGPYELLPMHDRSARLGQPAQQVIFRHYDHMIGRAADRDERTPSLDLRGWTGGDIGDQMASVLSLALGRRLRSGGTVRFCLSSGDPLGLPCSRDRRPPQMQEPGYRGTLLPGISDPASLSAARDLLLAYSKLNAVEATALTRAAAQFADALWWADADPRIAWMKLVGALEAGANHYDAAEEHADPVTLLKRHRGRLYGRLKKAGCEAATAIVAEDLARTFNVEQKLSRFVSAFTPDPPSLRPDVARVDFENLESDLALIYEYRSRELHDGVPFPLPLCQAPEEIDGTPAERFAAEWIEGSGGLWPSGDLPMYLHTFAYISGEVLRKWWARLAPD